MDLPNALMQLARNGDLLAVRPRGIALAMTPGMVIIRAGVPKPYRWSPAFADLIADDWLSELLRGPRAVGAGLGCGGGHDVLIPARRTLDEPMELLTFTTARQ